MRALTPPLSDDVSQSQQLATEIVQQLPKASVAALIASLAIGQVDPAAAAEFYQPPATATTTQQVCGGRQSKPLIAIS